MFRTCVLCQKASINLEAFCYEKFLKKSSKKFPWHSIFCYIYYIKIKQ